MSGENTRKNRRLKVCGKGVRQEISHLMGADTRVPECEESSCPVLLAQVKALLDCGVRILILLYFVEVCDCILE